MTTMTRRELLKASGTAGLALSAPAILSAQSKEPIPIGTLCPLTGAGGSYGPDMQRSAVAVVERINNAGGISGRPIQLFHEDDQTNAEAGVRAARKLIDVNRVVAIVSTWASAVTLAVKPLCVEAKVFLIGVSGADSVTQAITRGTSRGRSRTRTCRDACMRSSPSARRSGSVSLTWRSRRRTPVPS